MDGSAWDPAQYNRFAGEREQPFWDLIGLLEPVDAPHVLDLGCGDGRLTAALHRRLAAAQTEGVDSSPSMLAEAAHRAGDGLTFADGDLATWDGPPVDVLVSNAALQWVGGHRQVLGRWRRLVRPGGQLAFQVPTNADHPSHVVLRALAEERLGPGAPPDPVATNVLPPEAYATHLYELGFVHQHVRLQVYPHVLESSGAVVEWMKGTSLTRVAAVLAPDDFERFVDEYRERLLAVLGDRRPYFYAFKRILAWGRLP